LEWLRPAELDDSCIICAQEVGIGFLCDIESKACADQGLMQQFIAITFELAEK